MDYQTAVDWLFNQLANYQKQGQVAYKPGLDTIQSLLAHLNNPHQAFRSVHIAGTNGKGSTAHILTAMAIENGYKVGLFTSPHIKDFRERIKINGKPITEQAVIDFLSTNQSHFESLNPSFFEITTAMAFSIFAQEQCDIAIIETGLGGRLDSTNVIEPELALITNIGLDHTEMLGDTLALIAQEKAGIIKANTPVIIGTKHPETTPVFEQYAKAKNAPLTYAKPQTFALDLVGAYQQKNASLAWEALEALKLKGWYFDDQKSKAGLKRVKKNAGFHGRLEVIENQPMVIVDAAHNPEGIALLFEEVKKLPHQKLHCIYGSSNDKAYIESGALFPKSASYYLTTFDSSRALKAEALTTLAKQYNLDYTYHAAPELAFQAAKKAAKLDDLIVVFGSFFILEKII